MFQRTSLTAMSKNTRMFNGYQYWIRVTIPMESAALIIRTILRSSGYGKTGKTNNFNTYESIKCPCIVCCKDTALTILSEILHMKMALR